MMEVYPYKIRIDFVIRTGNVSPDIITSIIELEPTHVSYKGVSRPQGGTSRVNLWVLSAPDAQLNDTSLKAHWGALKNLLEPKSKEIRNLKHDIAIEIILTKLVSFEDIEIPSSMIELCHKMGVDIKIITYDMSEEDLHSN